MSAAIKLPNKITALILIPGVTIIFWAYPLFFSALVHPSFNNTFFSELTKLFIQFNANNATHLISIVKDLGII